MAGIAGGHAAYRTLGLIQFIETPTVKFLVDNPAASGVRDHRRINLVVDGGDLVLG